MEDNIEKRNYDKDFRKDFKKCIKAIMLSQQSDDVNKYLDKLQEYAKNHEIYSLSYNEFLKTINDLPDDGKEMISNIFKQGVSCGIVILISLLINNTGYFTDCIFDDE